MHISQTVQWIQSIVISLNLCPFAKREMDNNAVRIGMSSATSFEEGIDSLKKEIEHLNINPTTGTTLLLFPYFLSDFLIYLDFVDLANENIVQTGHQGIYQLATFHPAYQFHDTNIDDVTNYTNRSPYPMLHILREDMLDRAIDYYGNTEAIPANNILRLQSLGLAEVKKLWVESYS
ncbi:DUF1415 domain-containing protein [Legionella parisiensis]|uniref:DUF1415 domain-containing protein n=1 Tax=Legionella parisiensis TaxID=45071 RepID=A0A1E5JMV5_9GAMM|nr:DUF1415 domain-containing protein [Legionella parisiensis]KTD41441.1 hypothetical protein Lpar_2758 [Legionella parisiensis]OEH45800.1 hypothetical protein lpari_03207 [Legionella parisiensis]STX76255.1 Protein of uncharacterised function (DUF1415) [Legionella parisiensis]